MKNGFTLIELMVVMTVIAILSTMILFGLGKSQEAARDVQRQQTMKGIQAALARYYGDNGSYPVAGGTHGWFTGDLIALLVTQGYLTSPPTDPNSSCTVASDTSGATNWQPCSGKATPYYKYIYPNWSPTGSSTFICPGINDRQSYQLVLAKESGGYSTFCSPQ